MNDQANALAPKALAPLDFASLRQANVVRCEAVFFPLDAWSLTDWGCALGGEVGEALNVIKKLHRGDFGTVQARMEAVQALAKELADVVCYADLMAARAGIDLGEAVRVKFNEVSRRRGSPIRL